MRTISTLLSLVGSLSAATLAPSDPNATAAARQLYTYLQNLSGQGILSGQLSMLNDATNDTSSRERYVMARDGGRMPALYASNFGDWPMNYQDSIVHTIEARWKASGGKQVVMLCWHAVQPDTPQSLGYSAMSIFSAANPYPAWKIDSILKPGTALNIEWFHRLDTVAGYLKELDSAGIPVLWRPFHENNGAFFWWGQQPRFKELWQQMHHYYVDSLHLDNLLWVYSMCYFGQGDTWIDSLYPGDPYVDVLGADIYPGSYGQDYAPWIYSTLLDKGNGKPVGISENGTMPYVPTIKYTQPKWAFFCTWWGYEVDTMWVNAYYHPAGYSIQNPDSLYTAVYGDPYTVTLDQVNYGIAPDNHVFLSTSVTPTGGGTVAVSPDSLGRYHSGAKTTLTAEPSAGWDFAGWKGDTTASANPLSLTLVRDRAIEATFSPRVGTSLLLNGDFSQGLDDWSFTAWNNAAATAAVEGSDSLLDVSVTSSTGTDYNVQLTQSLLLDSGATYMLGFDAKASGHWILGAAVGENGGGYRKIVSFSDTLGTAIASFGKTFMDTLPSSDGLRLEFELGPTTGNVYLDNIKLALAGGASLLRAAKGEQPIALSLHRTSQGLSWALSRASSQDAEFRLHALDGREVARIPIAPGVREGALRMDLPHAVLVAQFLSGGKSLEERVLAP
jgi:mannan endo-1,4-beta-mannosidase